MTDEQCRLAGLSRAKAEALHRVAQAVVSGALDLDAVCSLEAALAIRELTAIKGVGRWTAEVYLLFCAGHPDVFPVGDVALQNAVGHALALEVKPTARELDGVDAGLGAVAQCRSQAFLGLLCPRNAPERAAGDGLKEKANLLFPFSFWLHNPDVTRLI